MTIRSLGVHSPGHLGFNSDYDYDDNNDGNDWDLLGIHVVYYKSNALSVKVLHPGR